MGKRQEPEKEHEPDEILNVLSAIFCSLAAAVFWEMTKGKKLAFCAFRFDFKRQ